MFGNLTSQITLWVIIWITLWYPHLTLSNNSDIQNELESTGPPGNGTEQEPHGIHIVSWRWVELSEPVLAIILILAVSLLKVGM